MLKLISRRVELGTRSSIALVSIVAIAAATAAAQTCFQGPNGCKYSVSNPCPINVCNSSPFTCSDGSAMWTKVVMPPPSWQFCDPYSGPFQWQCTETEKACGSTQHFYDANCSMYCDGTSTWVACLASSNNFCGGGP